MSQDYYIGLSRKQVEVLLQGGRVGKRPYADTELNPTGEICYDDTVRIHVKMTSRMEESLEPKAAFEW